MKVLSSLTSLFVVLMTYQCGAAQCPSPSTWMEHIVSVEGNDDSTSEKIKKLSSILIELRKCSPMSDSVHARVLHRLGDLYRVEGDMEKGITYTRNAIGINMSGKPGALRSFLVHSYYNLGLYFQLLNRYQEAQAYLDTCINVGQTFPEKAFIVRMAFERKAFLYFKSADYASSMATADRGIFAAERFSDQLGKALLLIQRAQARLELKEIDRAAEDMALSIDLLRKNEGSEFLPNAYSMQAVIFERQKKFNEAAALYKKAIDGNMAINNWDQATRDLQDLGSMYSVGLKDDYAAIKYYNEAIKMTEKTGDLSARASLYNNVAMVKAQRRDYVAALKYLQQGLVSLPYDFRDENIRSNPTTEHLRVLTNDYICMTLLANKAEALLNLYKTKPAGHDLGDALLTFQRVDFTIDQMRWKQNEGVSKMHWREKTKKWYALAIEVCFLMGNTDEAFYFFEKSRAILLNDRLNEINASSQLSPEDSRKEEQYRTKLVNLQERLRTYASDTYEYGKCRTEVFAAERELNHFIESLGKKYSVYFQYRYDRSVPSLKNVQDSLLSKDQILVSYFNTDTVTYVLSLDKGHAFLRKVAYPNLKTDVDRYLHLLGSSGNLNVNFLEYRKLSQKLYHSLVLTAGGPAKRMIFLHDEYFIPMEALVVNDDSGSPSYLLDKTACSYAYSASFLLKKRMDRRINASLLAIAPVYFKDHLGQTQLVGSDDALENMQFEGPSEQLIHEEATKRKLMDRLRDFDIVHVFSHSDPDYNGEPVLFLHDSVVKLKDLQMLTVPKTRLITLFACNTGIGKKVSGEGTFSLSRGFAAAGIPATITTMWAIDNKAAYSLADLFYQNINKGMDTDIALQQAKLQFRESRGDETILPYYWAGSVLVGPITSFQIERSFSWLWWLLIIPVILFAIITLRR